MKDLIKQIYETHDIREEKPQWAGHLNPLSYTQKAKTFSRPLRGEEKAPRRRAKPT
jgi:hypothetical protein